jgi:glyoxylase-like metal-dependent hydrolase (beta-lactamase superfamily II)
LRLVTRAPHLGAALVLGLLVALADAPAEAQQPGPFPQSVAELIQVREDVYAFRYLNHVSLFVPTDEGVVVVDPIGGGGNPQAPVALKGAISSISAQPVRWLVYSHAAADHSTGGAVFADTATFVSHANAKPALEARGDPTTPVPTVTFEDTLAIDLGGKHFELYWAGLTPQDQYLIFSYPAQKVIMTVDLGRVRTLPFGDLPLASPERFVEFLAHVDQSFDFEVFLSGHGPQTNVLGNRQDLQDHRQYFLDLMEAVRVARAAGQADNSEEMVATVRTSLEPRYGTWENFPNGLASNISGVLRWWNMEA